MEDFRLTEDRGQRFAALALRCVRQPYPYNPGHTVNGPDDARDPRSMHPAFCGCFDWHSAVHGHWLLVRILRRLPATPASAEIRSALRAQPHAGELAGGGCVLRRAGAQGLRANVRLGLAAEAGRGAGALGGRRRPPVGCRAPTAGLHYRSALPRLPASPGLPHSGGHASQHCVRAGLRVGLCAGAWPGRTSFAGASAQP